MEEKYNDRGKLEEKTYLILKVPNKFTMCGSEADFFEFVRDICINFKEEKVHITIKRIQDEEEID